MSYHYEKIYKSDKTAEICYNGNSFVISDFSFDRYDYYDDSTDSFFQVSVKTDGFMGRGRICFNYNGYDRFVNDLKRMTQFQCFEARIVSTYDVDDAILITMDKLGHISVCGSISWNDCRLDFNMEADQTVLRSFCLQLEDWLTNIRRKRKRLN